MSGQARGIPLEAYVGGEKTVRGKMEPKRIALESQLSSGGKGESTRTEASLVQGAVIIAVGACRHANGRGSEQGKRFELSLVGETPDKAKKLAVFCQIDIVQVGLIHGEVEMGMNNTNSLILVDRLRELAATSGELPTSPLANCGCNLCFLCFIFREDQS